MAVVGSLFVELSFYLPLFTERSVVNRGSTAQPGRGWSLMLSQPLQWHRTPLSLRAISPISSATLRGQGRTFISGISLRMIEPWSFSATPMGSVWSGCFLPTAEAVGYANPAAMRLRRCDVSVTVQ